MIRLVVFIITTCISLHNAKAADAVGTVEGTFTVSETGAAVYHVPFDIYPSGSGFDPKIGLQYNSQMEGYGNAGYGVSITGISVITRCNKDLFHDKRVQKKQYKSGDSYALDGKRLVLMSGEEGVDGAVYSVEGSPHTTVKLYGNDQLRQFPRFEVTEADGTVFAYEKYAMYDGKISSWYISKATNKYGDHIDYYYTTVNQVTYPSHIIYFHANEMNYVTFSYGNITHPVPFVMENGIRGSHGRKLTAVTSYRNAAMDTYRTYRLNYETADGSHHKYDRLVSVSVENENKESLKPLCFSWNTLEEARIDRSAANVETSDKFKEIGGTSSFLSVDQNGDGISDIIRICQGYENVYDYGQSRTKYYNRINFYHGSISDEHKYSFYDYAHLRTSPTFSTENISVSGNGFRVFDADGNGKNDIVIPYYYRSKYNEASWLYLYLISDDLSRYESDQIIDSKSCVFFPLVSKGNSAPFVTLDMNGNGKEEILYIEDTNVNGVYNGRVIYDIIPYSDDKYKSLEVGFRYSRNSELKRLFLADCNADGFHDLILLFADGYKVYYNNGTGNLQSCYTENNCSEFNGDNLHDYKHIEQGDLDGDGLIDFAVADDSQLYLIHNEGNGTFVKGSGHTFDFPHDRCNLAMRVVDADKDGRADVFVSAYSRIFSLFNVVNKNYCVLYRLQGTTFEPGIQTERGGNENDINEGYIFTGDYDGDGYPELANYGTPLNDDSDGFQEGRVFVYKFPTDISLGRVNRITNGYGKETTIEYASGTSQKIDIETAQFYKYKIGYSIQKKYVYDKYGNGSFENYETDAFPVNTYKLPIPLVASVTQTNGAAGKQTSNYYYSGMKLHLQGRGALGFGATLVNNTTLDTHTYTTVKEWDNESWLPTCTQTISAINGRDKYSYDMSFNTVTNAVARNNLWNGNYFTYCSENVTRDMDENYVTKTYSYDVVKGVPTEEKISYGLTGDTYSANTYGGYQKICDRWVPTVAQSIHKHKHDANLHTQTNRLTYDSNGDVLKLNSTSSYDGNNVSLTTTYTRNMYGRILSEMISGSNVRTITKKYSYDDKGIRVVREYTSPLLTDISYEYDKWGNVTSKCDKTENSAGYVTRYTYDNWGTLISVSHPDGTETRTETVWDSSMPDYTYKVISSQTGIPSVATVYDNEGRELAVSTTTGPQNIPVNTFTKYDNHGNVLSVKNVTGRMTLTSTMEYDSRGRVTKEHHADGTETTYTYDKTKVTIQSPRGTKTTEYDEEGNILQVTDNNSVINYTYTSLGKPSTITSGNNTVTLEYDGAGRRISLSDPDAGTQTYSYAADGTLLSQTDANGITVSYVYDAKGRLTGRLGGDCDETTVYGTSGNSKNRIVERRLDTGFLEKYSYDKLGHVLQVTREIDSWGTYSKSYEYDALGRKVKAIYPGDVEVKYEYDDSGNMTLMSIKDRYNTDFYCLDTWKYDGLKKVSFFGDISCTDSYYPATGQLACRTMNVLEDEELARINYSYDANTGNISARWFGCAEGQRKISMNGTSDAAGVMLPPMDSQLYKVETFEYDSSDRLTKITEAGPDGAKEPTVIRYEDNGNISYKSGVGEYGYSDERPHAVTELDYPEGDMTESEQSIVYNRDGNLDQVIQRTNGKTYVLTYWRGLEQAKWVETLNVTGERNARETIYFDDYERIVKGNDVTEQYFLDNDVLLIKKDGILTQYKAFKDAHGSILYIVDKSGNHVFEATYDAWGKQTVTMNLIDFRYGYCGHEMLNEVELIDMGGRVYDPALGRFLSCDNYVQEPTNSQNFNRYSYCLNNPLRYTDPTGQLFGIDDAVLAFAAFNLTSSLMQAYASGENMWTAAGRSILGSAVSFGFSNAINAIGGAFGHSVGSVGNELMRAGAHGVASGAFSAIQGNSFGTGFATGAVSSLVGSGVQSLGGSELSVLGSMTLTGGLTSVAFGGSFFNGAQIGLQIGALNHTWQEGGIRYNDDSGQIEGNIPDYVFTKRKWSLHKVIGETVNFASTSLSELGVSLKNNAENSVYGDNNKFYWKSLNSRAFYGNQYVKVTRLSNLGSTMIKKSGPFGTALNVTNLGAAVVKDISELNNYGTNWYSTVKASLNITSAIAGAKTGAAIGAYFGGYGSIPGTIIGGAIGGIAGSYGAGKISDSFVNYLYGY